MNRSLVEYREAVATELAVQGHTYEHIAEVLGYQSRSGAWKAVRRALKHRRDAAAVEYLGRQLDRLERQEDQLSRLSEAGDVDAGLKLLRVMERRWSLLGTL